MFVLRSLLFWDKKGSERENDSNIYLYDHLVDIKDFRCRTLPLF